MELEIQRELEEEARQKAEQEARQKHEQVSMSEKPGKTGSTANKEQE